MSSLKQYLIESYNVDLTRKTTKLTEYAKKGATAKNRWIFLEKCLKHNIVPKSFRVRCPLSSKNGERITTKYRYRLVQIARKEAKSRYYYYCSKVKDVNTELKDILTVDDYLKVQGVVEKSREGQFMKIRTKLQEKFLKLKHESFQYSKVNRSNQENTKLVKDAVLNLTNKDLPDHHKRLLNLGPKFVPTTNQVPYMDIIKNTEIAARSLEKIKQHQEAEHLRNEVCSNLKSSLKYQPKDNIDIDQENR